MPAKKPRVERKLAPVRLEMNKKENKALRDKWSEITNPINAPFCTRPPAAGGS